MKQSNQHMSTGQFYSLFMGRIDSAEVGKSMWKHTNTQSDNATVGGEKKKKAERQSRSSTHSLKHEVNQHLLQF